MKAFGQYVVLAAFLATASAQQPVWQQCGGIGWFVISTVLLYLVESNNPLLGRAERLVLAERYARN